MAPVKSSPNNQPSFQEKRTLLKSSTHVKGMMPIETYLKRLDPYRSTTLNWPYPHNILPAPPTTTEQIEHHRKAILAILDTYNFPAPQYLRFSVHSATKQLYCTEPLQVLSLAYIIDPESRKAPDIPENLEPAREEINSLLKQSDINDVHIEIVFVNQVFEPTCYPIRDDDPAAEAFESSRRNINRVVSRLRDKWSMVKMFNVGVTVETTMPTIVVQVNPGTEADWDGMAREMLAHFSKIDEDHGDDTDMDRNRRMEIGVEFMTGKIVKPIVYPEDEELADAFGNFSETLADALENTEDCEVIREDIDEIVDRLVGLAGERAGWVLERVGEVKRRKLE